MNAEPCVLTTEKGFYVLTDDPDEKPIGPLATRDEVKAELLKIPGARELPK